MNSCATRPTKQDDESFHFNGTHQKIARIFNGKIGNLIGDGKVALINSECRGFGRGPTDDDQYWAEFDLTPVGPNEPPIKCQVFFIFPLASKGQVFVTNTESQVVNVWFFREDKNYENTFLAIHNNQEKLLQHGGERLAGRVAIKWNSDSDFVIGADLVLPKDHSTWLQGEFVGSSKTRLNPILYEWPAILLFQESK